MNNSRMKRAQCDLFTFDDEMTCVSLEALVIDKVSKSLPRSRVNIGNWPEM